jgi:hypothetical protein
MATQEYAASIQGVAIRVTRLDASGNLLNGPGDSYTTSAFMRVSFTPEYEEGDEITEKSANGTICVSYKAPDTLKRITMELAICEPDPELSALISGGLLLRKNVNGVVKSVGWAAPGVGDDPAGNGVAIEAWSHAVKDGRRASILPYFHWVFPYAKLRQSGDRVIENGMMANTFEGYGLGNIQFASGLDGRWEFPVAAERPYSYARASWAPTGLTGFYTWTDYKSGNTSDQVFFTKAGIQSASTTTISGIKAQNTTAVVTLSNTLANAGIVTGDTIIATNLGNTFNTGSVGSNVISLANIGAATTTNASNVITVTSTAGLIAGTPIVSSTTGTIADHTVVSVTDSTTYVASVNAGASSNANTNTTNLSVANAFAYTLPSSAGANTVTGTIEAGSRITLADSITEAPNYTPVVTADIDAEYAGGNGIGTYNVPGGLNYNSDNDIDFIIKSNED